MLLPRMLRMPVEQPSRLGYHGTAVGLHVRKAHGDGDGDEYESVRLLGL